MTEYGADWYDVVLVEEGSPAMQPLELSPWLDVYETVAALIGPHQEVVDLGCGTGRFIELLYRRDHYARVTGIDWSVSALAEAQRYASPKHAEAPPPEWQLCDLAEWRPERLRAGNTVYTCTEVLEHLPDDRELVRRVPPGHRFLFTVPNFDSQAHVRVFAGVGDLWERYAGLLLFRSWRLVGEETRAIHVVETVRRADAW